MLGLAGAPKHFARSAAGPFASPAAHGRAGE
jgi:hypothetical protein